MIMIAVGISGYQWVSVGISGYHWVTMCASWSGVSPSGQRCADLAHQIVSHEQHEGHGGGAPQAQRLQVLADVGDAACRDQRPAKKGTKLKYMRASEAARQELTTSDGWRRATTHLRIVSEPPSYPVKHQWPM